MSGLPLFYFYNEELEPPATFFDVLLERSDFFAPLDGARCVVEAEPAVFKFGRMPKFDSSS